MHEYIAQESDRSESAASGHPGWVLSTCSLSADVMDPGRHPRVAVPSTSLPKALYSRRLLRRLAPRRAARRMLMTVVMKITASAAAASSCTRTIRTPAVALLGWTPVTVHGQPRRSSRGENGKKQSQMFTCALPTADTHIRISYTVACQCTLRQRRAEQSTRSDASDCGRDLSSGSLAQDLTAPRHCPSRRRSSKPTPGLRPVRKPIEVRQGLILCRVQRDARTEFCGSPGNGTSEFVRG